MKDVLRLCRICGKNLAGKARFMSWLPDGRRRGPFCIKCVRTPVAQIEKIEIEGEVAHKVHMDWVLGRCQ